MTSRRPVGLFVGLSTLDVIQLVERPPEADDKAVALDICVAAGGPAANAAVAFAALGGEATLVTRIGEDAAGALVIADLEACGVSVLNADDGTTRTAVATVLVTASTGSRAVVSPGDFGRSGEQAEHDTYASLVADMAPDVVVIDSYETDLSLPVCREAARRSTPVILDCGSRKAHTERQLPFVSAAVVSERYLPGSAAEIIDAIRSRGVPFGAVTAGAKPVTWWDDAGSSGTTEVPTVQTIDTLGAGDFFHGALAFEIAREGLSPLTFPAALHRAAEVAALSVGSFGSRGWRADLHTAREWRFAAGLAAETLP